MPRRTRRGAGSTRKNPLKTVVWLVVPIPVSALPAKWVSLSNRNGYNHPLDADTAETTVPLRLTGLGVSGSNRCPLKCGTPLPPQKPSKCQYRGAQSPATPPFEAVAIRSSALRMPFSRTAPATRLPLSGKVVPASFTIAPRAFNLTGQTRCHRAWRWASGRNASPHLSVRYVWWCVRDSLRTKPFKHGATDACN